MQWKKNAAVFLTSQAISLFGSSLVQFAITWYITLTTQSGVYMTISIICSILPTLFVSPFAGVWADRYDRKKLIMISDGLIALSTLGLAIVFLMGYKALWLLYAVSVMRAIGGAIQTPSVNAMLPDIVPEEQLTRVNGINGSIQSLLSLVSPALAGVLLNVVGSIELIFFIDVVTAAVAILVLAFWLHQPRAQRAGSLAPKGYLAEIGEGLAYIRSVPYLKHMFFFVIAVSLCIAPVSFLTPLQVVRNYGEEVWRLTAIEVVFSGGMLLGGLLLSTWGGLKNKVKTMALAILITGGLTVALGLSIPFWLYVAVMLLVGLSMTFFNTPAIIFLQERVDPAYMGRVFSVISMVTSSMMPLGMLVFGPLADRFAIEGMLIGTGGLVVLAGAVLLMDRTIMRAGMERTMRAKGAGVRGVEV